MYNVINFAVIILGCLLCYWLGYLSGVWREREKVEKLEGWLKLLYYHHCDDIETDKTLQEISDYIKKMEGK